MIDDELDPLSVLMAARPAFGGTSEAERALALTDAALIRGNVTWLEVGAGDGRHLAFQLERLSSGRRISAIALEPSPHCVVSTVPNIIWVRQDIESFQPDCLFDWINLRHSLYYIDDPIRQIERLVGFLKVGGALALTHWASACALYRLHRVICGEPGVATSSIETLAEHLGRFSGAVVSPIEYGDSRLDVNQVASDAHIAEALFELARRGCDSGLAAGTDPITFTVETLRTMPNAESRWNGMLIVRKQSA
jgi:hypothetical protein